ncbi:hypothetical protein WR25_15904 [Diploscapter pachys]|uniref:DNA 3'-5' helicase n=1 Tax=Diploscapter pachys TaxID=2018661 RepID=A0A2A2KHH3_9BILA|nr:hypothetical protein WR25_15904 [Diploscapter pachys]
MLILRKKAKYKIFISSFVRSNLKYEVIQRKVNILQDVMKKMMKQFGDKTAGIIYCLSRKNCETTARTLRGWNFKVDVYHAGLSDGFRTVVQRQWQANEVNVIRATIAFGMGIDKPDVRYVIHIALPKSIEGYYQETDRVGRDRVPFYCPLLYNYSDIIQLRKMIEGDGGVHVRAAVRGPCRVGDDGLCRIDPKGQRRRSGQNYFQGISMFLKMVFTFMVLAAHTMKADASEEEEEEFDIFKLRTSSFGCPLMILDDPCPEENLLYYFSCCGEIEDERYCCFKLQDWELVLILPVTCVALIIIVRIFYLRCFHGSHKRTTKLPSNLPSSSSPRALSTLSPSNSASLDFENANSLMLLPIRELHHHSSKL